MFEVIAAGLASNNADNGKCADQRDGIDGGVEKSRRKSFTAAGDKAKQRVAAMGNGRVSEEPADIGLGQRDKIAEQNRQRGEQSEHRRPARHHRMPAGVTVDRPKADEHNFPEHNE